MAGTWLLFLLALGCPTLPTGVGGTPFPSLAPPITLLADGKQQMVVVCLVLDVAPPGLDSPIWFSAGNGSALDAFTYGPSPATDGTWTSLAHLSLPSEELASWEPLVCHTGPGAEGHSRSTQPLQLSGEASTARTCPWEPLRGMPGGVLWLGVLRLLLFKLLLFDLLLTCSRLRHPAGPPPSPAAATRLRALGSHRLYLATETGGREATSSPRPQPRDHGWSDTLLGRKPGSPVWEEGSYLSRYPTCPAQAWCSRSDLRIPSSGLGAFFACDLPPPLQAGAA
ncbi:PREDICTED: pre T-cell antigen receptor alpha isoform X2 [Colobus angolensis palliatus]|uniref:Pre T-cell antigen receptor alpha n=1 Tax=Colobus angolensis palliatus TaxID=336983 RepID=A0A2K5JQ45_COLAP|nr:PREDICTED: pre T-cell antigen receptor alpha isoform X2 [Colobus angolensis palliatus]